MMVSVRICLIFLEGVSSVSALLLSEVKLFLSGFPPLTFAREKKNKKNRKAVQGNGNGVGVTSSLLCVGCITPLHYLLFYYKRIPCCVSLLTHYTFSYMNKTAMCTFFFHLSHDNRATDSGRSRTF